MIESRNKPRVLMIITLFSVGGATETVVSLAKGLQDKGYDVTIVSGPHVPLEGNMLSMADAANLNVTIIPELKRNIHTIDDFRAFIRLVRFIREGDFEIVHTHSSKAGVLGRFAAKYCSVPAIVHTIHGLPFHRFQNPLIRKLFIVIERITAQVTSVLLSVSHRIISDCLAVGVGTPNQFVVVRSGFDPLPFVNSINVRDTTRSQLALQNNHIVLGIISRLSKLKGHDRLLRVLPPMVKEFPMLRVLFIGDGEHRNELQRMVKDLGLSDIVLFLGSVAPPEIPKMIAATDIIIHTSLHEGLARVLPQALLMGKPVISYDLDGAPEVVRHNYNGLLISPLDDYQLMNSIRRMVTDYKFFAENCVRDREHLVSEFSNRRMVEDVCAIYRELLNRKFDE